MRTYHTMDTLYSLRYQQTADGNYTLLVRDGTFDSSIIHMVYDNDEYQLPYAHTDRAIAIDIGAHIGAFSLLAASRGYIVHAFEAHLHNYRLLTLNTRQEPRVLPMFGAVFGHIPTDKTPMYMVPQTFVREQHMDNTGGMSAVESTLFTDGLYVPSVSFDAVMLNALQSVHRDAVIVVKLDCEGAEDSILRNSTTIQLAHLILAEYHYGYESAVTYAELLKQHNFVTTITPVTSALGYLRAERR